MLEADRQLPAKSPVLLCAHPRRSRLSILCSKPDDRSGCGSDCLSPFSNYADSGSAGQRMKSCCVRFAALPEPDRLSRILIDGDQRIRAKGVDCHGGHEGGRGDPDGRDVEMVLVPRGVGVKIRAARPADQSFPSELMSRIDGR